MYIYGLAQPLPGPTPQPAIPGPPPVSIPQPLSPGTQAPMPNLAVQPQPIVGPADILLIQSRIQCNAAQVATIQSIVGPGKPLTADIIKLAIHNAHDRVFGDLTDENMPPRRALAGPRDFLTQGRFRTAFGRSPDEFFRPGARWDLGRIVATRLHGARIAMFSSSVRISCFGWPWPGGGPDHPMNYMVKTLPHRELVALGALFWRSFAIGDFVSQGAALLMAGLVIRYGLSYGPLAPPVRNIHCYVKYGLLMLQHAIPKWVDENCPTTV